ncbi:MAG: HAD family hydrolase [Granulosicoccaceae bacterium]
MQKQIKGVLFDKDGTLFEYGDTWQVWSERVVDELAAGEQVLRDQLAQSVGYCFQSKRFSPGSLVVNASSNEIIEAWAMHLPHLSAAEIEQVGIRHLGGLPLNPVCDLAQLANALRQMGLAVGCGTNDYESSAREQLGRAGVLQHFDFVCGFDSGHGAKPGPGMLLAFAEHIGAQPSELVMVGDSTHDLHSGEAAGVALNIGVLTGPARREDIASSADEVLPSVASLPDWLLSNT